MEHDYEIAREGLMRKRGSRANNWDERYFVLKGPTLFYFLKPTDTEPKAAFILKAACRVSEIGSDLNKKRKQFLFRITWPSDEEAYEKEDSLYDGDVGRIKGTMDKKLSSSPRRRIGSKKSYSKDERNTITGGKIAAVAIGGIIVGALTASIGLIAGMVFVGIGVAVGGGAVAAQDAIAEKEKSLTLACETYDDAEKWVHAIEAQIRELGDSVLGLPCLRGLPRKGKTSDAPLQMRLEEVNEWIRSSRWRVCNVNQGIRIFEQQCVSLTDSNTIEYMAPTVNVKNSREWSRSNLMSSTTLLAPPCLRVNVSINGSPTDVFNTLMSMPQSCLTGIIKSMRLVEIVDDHTDILHIQLEPVYLHPTWTTPRDMTLLRYWDHYSDGSYAICLDSTFHHDCPLVPGYVRAEFHGVYLISPPKDGEGEEDQMDCLLTLIAQMDPKGWIWRSLGYQHQYLEQILLHTVDVRDSLDAERFMQVQFDANNERQSHHRVPGTTATTNAAASTANVTAGARDGKTNASHSMSTSVTDSTAPPAVTATISNTPPPSLPVEMWSEPDAASFKVRGKTYNQDRMKISSPPALFKLVAVDLFEVDGNTPNIASHPKNRVFQALQRGEDSWTFVVNIMVPGPPYLSFVVYMSGDRKLFAEDSPFARVARPFFFGNDDELRNNRFKLIPKVVDGNMIVKMAVKDTPTLLGNKLKQTYYKGDNYFELDVDVGSSSVARNVVGLAIGYSKAIVVDMGFCLQGNDESELPEIIMGCATCVRIDTTVCKRL